MSSPVPEDYEDLLSYYTKNGYRVIGIAGKTVDGLSWLKAQRMKREQVESGLQFLGLVIFENKLKPGTTPAIATLREAHLGCRMVTGDNPRTAVSVARECRLINSTAFVFYPVFVEGNASTPRARLQWIGVDDESLRLDPYSLRPLPPPPHIVEDEDRIYRDYALVLPGDVFRWMVNHAALETLQQVTPALLSWNSYLSGA
jgi:cation-transporting ATPase 13A2